MSRQCPQGLTEEQSEIYRKQVEGFLKNQFVDNNDMVISRELFDEVVLTLEHARKFIINRWICMHPSGVELYDDVIKKLKGELLEECLKQLNSLDVHNDLTKRIEEELAKPAESVFLSVGDIDDILNSCVELEEYRDCDRGDSIRWVLKDEEKFARAIEQAVLKANGILIGDKLYTHPQAQQKPLSVDEIKALWEASLLKTNSFTLDFTRAIEKAHGIGVKDEH